VNAEIIAIGDELTSGQRLDTNTQWLSQQLGTLGVRVKYHTTVADDLSANVDVFRAAIQRAEIVIATGGLGPTADDLTRDAIATATDRPLHLDEDVLAWIHDLFRSRGREAPERNRVQAMFPEGSRVIPNPHGTAPGIELTVARPSGGTARIFALPGVPAEMREMWEASVAPAIAEAAGGERQVIVHRRIKCFGVGESALEEMLPDLIRRGREPAVGITVHMATITLRITARAPTADAAAEAMQPTIATIHEQLGQLVFGEEEDELEHVVIRMLRERAQTLATLECGTGGIIANWLNNVDGAHRCFVGGRVAPRPAMGVDLKTDIQTASPDREETILAARETRAAMGADYALTISQFPAADTDRGEPPPFYIALEGPLGTVSAMRAYAGHPDILRERAAKQALDLLRLHLLEP